jgi:glyoxylase-like metal-dependent hydrolase (beta-lactamase superfamily II)
LGIPFLKEKFNIPFYANKKDESIFESTLLIAQLYGFDINKIPEIDIEIKENDKINFGNSTLEIIEVPGHTPGHVALVLNPNSSEI